MSSRGASRNPDPSRPESLKLDFEGTDDQTILFEAWVGAGNKLRFRLTIRSPLGRFNPAKAVSTLKALNNLLEPEEEPKPTAEVEDSVANRILNHFLNHKDEWFTTHQVVELTGSSLSGGRKVLQRLVTNKMLEYQIGSGRASQSKYRMPNQINRNRTQSVPSATGTVNGDAD